MNKILIAILGCCLMVSAYGGTLFILAKKIGQPAVYLEHPYVVDYGWNNANAFVVRLNNGQEIVYGKRSHWEEFTYTYYPDSDLLIKN